MAQESRDLYFNIMPYANNQQENNGQAQRRGGRNTGQRRRPARRQEGPTDGFDSQVIDLARVTRVASGGRRFRFRAVVVSGDKKGKVGVGVAKGSDVASAIEKATRQAKKNVSIIPMAGHTIPHQVEAKFSASRVLLKPQQQGRGIVAGGPVRIICEAAGIQDISAKFISKTHNKLNNALVTIKALAKLKAITRAAPAVKASTEPTPIESTPADLNV